MIGAQELQQQVVAWHERRFPEARMELVGLKLAEEAGEVGKAINGLIGQNSATGGGDVAGESADVLITLMVLLGRWFPDADLFEEVQRKLLILTDPNSGHPAAYLEEMCLDS